MTFFLLSQRLTAARLPAALRQKNRSCAAAVPSCGKLLPPPAAVSADEFPDIETAAPDSHSLFVPKTFPDNRRAAYPAPSAVFPSRPFPRFVSKQSADPPALHPMPAAPQEASA